MEPADVGAVYTYDAASRLASSHESQCTPTIRSTGVIGQYIYDPYGKVTVLAADGTTVRSASSYGNSLTFTGRRLDSETGLYFFRNRYYSAELGRFIGRDPLGYVDGNNMYQAYMIPNALDPFGTDDEKKEQVIHVDRPLDKNRNFDVPEDQAKNIGSYLEKQGVKRVETYNGFTWEDYKNSTRTLWKQQALVNAKGETFAIIKFPDPDVGPLPILDMNGRKETWDNSKITLGRSEYPEQSGFSGGQLNILKDAIELVKSSLKEAINDPVLLQQRLKKLPPYMRQGEVPCDAKKTKELLEAMLEKMDVLKIQNITENNKDQFNIPKGTTLGLTPPRPTDNVALFGSIFKQASTETPNDVLRRVAGTLVHEVSHATGTDDTYHFAEKGLPQFTGIPYAQAIPAVVMPLPEKKR